jgi:hypothetical protein
MGGNKQNKAFGQMPARASHLEMTDVTCNSAYLLICIAFIPLQYVLRRI